MGEPMWKGLYQSNPYKIDMEHPTFIYWTLVAFLRFKSIVYTRKLEIMFQKFCLFLSDMSLCRVKAR